MTNDIAATLGGEMTIAVDGPLLPSPSWKVAVEVNNPTRLEWSIEQVVKSAQQADPDAKVQLTNEVVGGLTYYVLSSAKSPVAVNYVFTDGYLLMAPNHGLLSTSIQNRTAGTTLTQSTTFRQQLPQNGQMNFSALAWYNASAAIAPMADQPEQTKFLTADPSRRRYALEAVDGGSGSDFDLRVRGAGPNRGGDGEEFLRAGGSRHAGRIEWWECGEFVYEVDVAGVGWKKQYFAADERG